MLYCIIGIEAAPVLSCIIEMSAWLQMKTVFILKLKCIRMEEVNPLSRPSTKLKLKIGIFRTNFQSLSTISVPSSEESAGRKNCLF